MSGFVFISIDFQFTPTNDIPLGLKKMVRNGKACNGSATKATKSML